MRIAIAAAALVLAACTPMQWVKPDAAPGQFQADMDECRKQAWQEAQMRMAFYHPMAPAVVTDSLGRRLLVYPYGPFADPFGHQFMEEDRLAEFCMQNKGWTLQEVPKAQAAKQ
ncbi:MAG: hypothetical protein ACT4P3_03205 [Betaproteobacteria bacterium]